MSVMLWKYMGIRGNHHFEWVNQLYNVSYFYGHFPVIGHHEGLRQASSTPDLMGDALQSPRGGMVRRERSTERTWGIHRFPDIHRYSL